MLVVVAAHNEAERIGATLAGLREAFPAAALWVADDGSTDATAAIARAGGAAVASTGLRGGKGHAMTVALRRALVAGDGAAPAVAAADVAGGQAEAMGTAGDGVVLLCDGDLGSSVARLGPLVEAVTSGETDIAVAAFSRRQGGGFGIALGFARWAIRGRCGLRARAPLSGQRALRADSLPRLLPFAAGYGMEVGMTIDAVRLGMRVREIELDLEHRASGRTPAGFAHRARQLLDVARVYAARR